MIGDLKDQQRFTDLLGTVLTIISESSSIEHALADQDEDDRARMQLVAKSDRLKVDDLTRTTMIHDPSSLSMN